MGFLEGLGSQLDRAISLEWPRTWLLHFSPEEAGAADVMVAASAGEKALETSCCVCERERHVMCVCDAWCGGMSVCVGESMRVFVGYVHIFTVSQTPS